MNPNENESATPKNESLLGLNNVKPSSRREERSLFGIGNLRPENCQPQGSTGASQIQTSETSHSNKGRENE